MLCKAQLGSRLYSPGSLEVPSDRALLLLMSKPAAKFAKRRSALFPDILKVRSSSLLCLSGG